MPPPPPDFIKGRLVPRALVLLLLAVSSAAAQFRGDTVRADFSRLGGDIWGTVTSPASATVRSLAAAGGAAALVGAVSFVDRDVSSWMHGHPESVVMRVLQPLREDARYPLYELGSGQYLLPLSAVLYLSGLVSKASGLRDAGLGCAAAHLTSAGVRDLVYLLVARDRPRIAPGDPYRIALPGVTNWDRHSFFSGHIANSMGCASFFAHRYSLGVAEPAMYAYVVAIGAGRMADGRHWASDTMAGALFGFAVGKSMADRQRGRERSASPGAGARGRRPAPMALMWSVQF